MDQDPRRISLMTKKWVSK